MAIAYPGIFYRKEFFLQRSSIHEAFEKQSKKTRQQQLQIIQLS